MGQYGNQPDFATNNIKSITPNNTISHANFLDSSLIYIGDNTTTGDVMVVIPTGVTRDGQVSAASVQDGGSGYSVFNSLATTGGSGDGLLTVNVTSVSGGGSVTGVTIDDPGVGYKVGDIITIDAGGGNALLKITRVVNTPTAAESVAFYGLQAGGFLPVPVDYVLASNASDTTTVGKLIAAK